MRDEETENQGSEDHLGMTPAQWDWFQRYTRGFGDQDENGIDLSLLRENLKLTPTERVLRLQRALRLEWEIRRGRSAS
jgi:hypothetical protein